MFPRSPPKKGANQDKTESLSGVSVGCSAKLGAGAPITQQPPQFPCQQATRRSERAYVRASAASRFATADRYTESLPTS